MKVHLHFWSMFHEKAPSHRGFFTCPAKIVLQQHYSKANCAFSQKVRPGSFTRVVCS